MSFTKIALVALATMAAPASAWAFGAGAGCADLPDYYRAQGALQGMPGACDMSVEQARRIVAAQDGPAAVYAPVAPAPRARHRHHRVRAPQE